MNRGSPAHSWWGRRTGREASPAVQPNTDSPFSEPFIWIIVSGLKRENCPVIHNRKHRWEKIQKNNDVFLPTTTLFLVEENTVIMKTSISAWLTTIYGCCKSKWTSPQLFDLALKITLTIFVEPSRSSSDLHGVVKESQIKSGFSMKRRQLKHFCSWTWNVAGRENMRACIYPTGGTLYKPARRLQLNINDWITLTRLLLT